MARERITRLANLRENLPQRINDVMIGIGIDVVTTAITTGITFYVKDYLKERAKFQKFCPFEF